MTRDNRIRRVFDDLYRLEEISREKGLLTREQTIQLLLVMKIDELIDRLEEILPTAGRGN